MNSIVLTQGQKNILFKEVESGCLFLCIYTLMSKRKINTLLVNQFSKTDLNPQASFLEFMRNTLGVGTSFFFYSMTYFSKKIKPLHCRYRTE